MARYGPEHKDRTRARLLERARAEFRTHGFDALSIDKIMKAAGLTRGAFYAHFASKEALVREVLAVDSGLVSELDTLAPGDAQGAIDALDRYLSPAERQGRVQCPLVAHPMDARRGGDTRARLYEQQVRKLIAGIQRAEPSADAVYAAVLAVGAAVLSSAVEDDALAADIEVAAQQGLRKELQGH